MDQSGECSHQQSRLLIELHLLILINLREREREWEWERVRVRERERERETNRAHPQKGTLRLIQVLGCNNIRICFSVNIYKEQEFWFWFLTIYRVSDITHHSAIQIASGIQMKFQISAVFFPLRSVCQWASVLLFTTTLSLYFFYWWAGDTHSLLWFDVFYYIEQHPPILGAGGSTNYVLELKIGTLMKYYIVKHICSLV